VTTITDIPLTMPENEGLSVFRDGTRRRKKAVVSALWQSKWHPSSRQALL